MEINLNLFRQITILSGLFGIPAGLIALIPYLGTYSLIFEICLIAPLIIWLLVKYTNLPLNSAKDSVIIGALSGFLSFLAFCLAYVPLTVILIKFFRISSNYGVALMLNNASFFILVVLSIFMGILSATVNAFTGFLAYSVLNLFKK